MTRKGVKAALGGLGSTTTLQPAGARVGKVGSEDAQAYKSGEDSLLLSR
jgi:hypothetical protein